MFETLTALVQPWADVFAEHPRLATALIATHVLAMFVGGGLAIGADRAILRATPGSAEAVRAVIADLAQTHTFVLSALVLSVVSGVALFTTDVPTYSASPVYWAKIGTLALLLANGLRMRRDETRVLKRLDGIPVHTAEMPVSFPLQPWRGVRVAAGISFGLWSSLVLLGVLLSNG